MTSGPEPVGTLDVALAHAEKLLVSQPSLAAEQAPCGSVNGADVLGRH